MLFMLSGINSLKTIQEVIRGYTGDQKAKQMVLQVGVLLVQIVQIEETLYVLQRVQVH